MCELFPLVFDYNKFSFFLTLNLFEKCYCVGYLYLLFIPLFYTPPDPLLLEGEENRNLLFFLISPPFCKEGIKGRFSKAQVACPHRLHHWRQIAFRCYHSPPETNGGNLYLHFPSRKRR